MIVGFDIDGVFVNDFVPNEWTLEKVAVMQAARQMMPPIFDTRRLLHWMKSSGHKMFLATARPQQDAEQTRQWKIEHGMSGTLLFMQDTKEVLDTEQAAHFKARTCKQQRAELFIESCPNQAKIIRLCLPKLRVIVFEDMMHQYISQLIENVERISS